MSVLNPSIPCTVVAMARLYGTRESHAHTGANEQTGGEACLSHRLSAASACRARYDRVVAIEHRHRDLKGGGARAAVFGISDGLVSNVALILGVAGAHPPAGTVRLAGLAGLIGGAFSMAAGEYISMRGAVRAHGAGARRRARGHPA